MCVLSSCVSGSTMLHICDCEELQTGRPRMGLDWALMLASTSNMRTRAQTPLLFQVMRVRGWEAMYPLFTTVNRIINGHLEPSQILHYSQVSMPVSQCPRFLSFAQGLCMGHGSHHHPMAAREP